MSLTSLSRPRSTRQLGGFAAIVAAVVPAAIIAIGLDAAVAAIAHAAGVSHHFKPLDLSSYAFLTVIGVGAGGVGWAVIRSRTANPARTLRLLVPVVLVASFLPDISIGLSKSMSSTTWGGVAALMVMHLLVAAAALPAYLLTMPIDEV